MEDTEDVRFMTRVATVCASDKEKFCKGVQPGRARALECLIGHRFDAEFTSECKKEIDDVAIRRGHDWRLDWRLRMLCKKDIRSLCYEEMAESSQPGNITGCASLTPRILSHCCDPTHRSTPEPNGHALAPDP